jgi:acetyl-CoA carboxylase carboxyl transferase subunit beta
MGKELPAAAWDGFSLRRRRDVPEGLWMRCQNCGAMLYRKAVTDNRHVCPECQQHFRIGARTRIEMLVDPGSFEEEDEKLESADPLKFKDLKSYKSRLADQQKKTGLKDAVVCGKAFIKGRPVSLAVMDANFIMASMGAVVGEKITRAIERALDEEITLIICCASGGARMMEGLVSLMQMAKTSAALARLDEAGGLYISVLTDPTTAGVAASYANLGDIVIAEPEALIGFAGPRVIWHTTKTELPEGFQTAEFVMEHGFIDMIVHRKDLRDELARLIDYCGK